MLLSRSYRANVAGLSNLQLGGATHRESSISVSAQSSAASHVSQQHDCHEHRTPALRSTTYCAYLS